MFDSRTLVNSFPESGLGVSVATDGTLFQSDVFAVSHGEMSSRSPRRITTTTWGHQPVLLLFSIRLGIEGVNPVHYETIKVCVSYTHISENLIIYVICAAPVHIPTICGHCR